MTTTTKDAITAIAILLSAALGYGGGEYDFEDETECVQEEGQ